MSIIILHSRLCEWCPGRSWTRTLPDLPGWFWCSEVKDSIHITMGCHNRKYELSHQPRVPLAVRLGSRPNDQGEWLNG